MFKKIILLIFVCAVVISSMLYYFSNAAKHIATGRKINVLFVIEQNTKNYPTVLKFIVGQYDSANGRLLFLFVDENISVLKRKTKTKTLKEMFYANPEEERIDFIKRELYCLFKNKLFIDYYVYADSQALNSFLELFNRSKMDKMLGTGFLDEILSGVHRFNAASAKIKTIKYIINNLDRNKMTGMVKFLKDNQQSFSTDFKFFDFFTMHRIVCSINTDEIIFVEVPTVFKRNRRETEAVSFNKVINILNDSSFQKNYSKINLKVLNSSNKSRLADKAVNVLRKNSFDVFYWGNELQKVKSTLILDMVNNHDKAKKISKILGCGEILVLPNPEPFADITVLLGDDCNLYDKLDKINLKTGE